MEVASKQILRQTINITFLEIKLLQINLSSNEIKTVYSKRGILSSILQDIFKVYLCFNIDNFHRILQFSKLM